MAVNDSHDSLSEPVNFLFETARLPVKATLVVLPKSLLRQWQHTIENQVIARKASMHRYLPKCNCPASLSVSTE